MGKANVEIHVFRIMSMEMATALLSKNGFDIIRYNWLCKDPD